MAGLGMILGREQERRSIAAALERARNGSSVTLIVSGEPGIGKSTLIDDVIANATRITALRAEGIDAESDIAFAGLLSLLRPILALVDTLPGHHARALRGALSMSGERTNGLEVGAATLALLATAAEDEPVVVVVDDAQWVDEPTIVALSFALHRLHADRVAALIAVRTEGRAAWRHMGHEELELGGLDVDAAFELMSAHGEIVRAVADRCHAAVGGNPLALVEVGARLDGAQRVGDRQLDTPPLLGRRLSSAFGERIEALDADARTAVLVAALADRPGLGPVLAALQTLGIDEGSLAAAERAAILSLHDGEFRFCHPLLRAAAVGSAEGSQQRAAHRALASALLDQPAEQERYSWHLAAAASGPDEEAAAALELTAGSARWRGAPTSAANALERAARLSPDPSEATRRLVAAGDAHLVASGPYRALGCWRIALDSTIDAAVRAGTAGRIGEAVGWFEDNAAAVDFLVGESDRVATSDPASASGLLVRASMLAGLAGTMHRAVLIAHKAVELAPAGGYDMVAAHGALALAFVNSGDQQRGADDLAKLDSLTAEINEPDEAMLPFFQMAAFSQMVREDWARARTTLDTIIRCSRSRGVGAVLSFASAVRADVSWRTGRWAEARADAAVAVSFSDAVHPPAPSFGHAVLARVEACIGLDEACRENAAAAGATAGNVGMVSLQMWSDAAIGLLELGRGEFRPSAAALERVAASCRAGSINDPSFLWWQADLAESALASGRRNVAEAVLADLSRQQRTTGRAWATVAIGRISGLLERDRADEHMESSLAAATCLGAPFEQGRTMLCWAEVDRDRHPDRARRRADEAAEIFQSLGAVPWVGRAETVVGGAAGPIATSEPHRRPAGIASLLSASELRVALAIGSGASSRAAAEQLYVSVRTVEFHLNSIYRKLHVRSRTELALRVERDRRGG